MIIQTTANIRSTREEFLNFFKKLLKDPTLYQFSTHKGFIPIEGPINKVGSKFKTEETFAGVKIVLFFETTRIDENSHFEFKLIEPFKSAKIIGRFLYKIQDEMINLNLTISSNAKSFFEKIAASLVFFTPIRLLVRNQINKEVLHIKESVETKTS
jgi:hypothetical protein